MSSADFVQRHHHGSKLGAVVGGDQDAGIGHLGLIALQSGTDLRDIDQLPIPISRAGIGHLQRDHVGIGLGIAAVRVLTTPSGRGR